MSIIDRESCAVNPGLEYESAASGAVGPRRSAPYASRGDCGATFLDAPREYSAPPLSLLQGSRYALNRLTR